MPIDDVHTLAVGRQRLADEALIRLSQAATVVGPAALIDAVAHLCPPTVTLVRDGAPEDAPRPVVVLVPDSGEQRD